MYTANDVLIYCNPDYDSMAESCSEFFQSHEITMLSGDHANGRRCNFISIQ